MTLVSCPYLQLFPSRAGKVTGACYTLLPSPLVGRFHIQTPRHLGPTTSEYNPHIRSPSQCGHWWEAGSQHPSRHVHSPIGSHREGNRANIGAGPPHTVAVTHTSSDTSE